MRKGVAARRSKVGAVCGVQGTNFASRWLVRPSDVDVDC
jgi:hypothetical protein